MMRPPSPTPASIFTTAAGRKVSKKELLGSRPCHLHRPAGLRFASRAASIAWRLAVLPPKPPPTKGGITRTLPSGTTERLGRFRLQAEGGLGRGPDRAASVDELRHRCVGFDGRVRHIAVEVGVAGLGVRNRHPGIEIPSPLHRLTRRRHLQEVLEDRVLVKIELRRFPRRRDLCDRPFRAVRCRVQHRDQVAVDHHRRAVDSLDA